MFSKCFSILSLVAAIAGVSGVATPASAADWFNCKPTAVFEVGTTGTPISEPMIEVACSNAIVPGVNYVALRAASFSEGQKDRFLSMTTAAILSGKSLRVWYVDSQCGNQANCRYVSAWSFYP